ncbi:hypothetical protein ACIVBQ_000576 [Tenacibaculum discolor]
MSEQVKTSEFQEVFYSETHQAFYLRTSAKMPPKGYEPFMVGSIKKFSNFYNQLNVNFTSNKITISKAYLDEQLDNFLTNNRKANEILVEAKHILGID